MGRGDKKTKKGKIWKGSYGNSRKRAVNKVKHTPAAKTAEKVEAKPKVKKAVKKKAKPADNQ
ncbi:MAG: 30S ribosomal protein THX [Cyclobacteriaceae bacterium]|nr:30S ribosomal protein THX [Cyclobacteriaceae bacterium]